MVAVGAPRRNCGVWRLKAFTTRRRPLATAVLAAVLLAPGLLGAEAEAKKGSRSLPGCGPDRVPGGEWRSYGHDYANTRYQDEERVISPADVPLLSPAWTFSTTDAGGDGDITSTPVVADGCLYVATTAGWVFALNADTGKLRWKARVPHGGGVNGSIGVTRRRVYVAV